MVHSVVILYDILKCREKIESKEAQLCILTLFETYARRILGSGRPLDPRVLPPGPIEATPVYSSFSISSVLCISRFKQEYRSPFILLLYSRDNLIPLPLFGINLHF